ncbi:MAG TPA: cell surface protein SprA [Flavobacterium sp.]|nr:cell surface protein SprA [Flavobacterium sp.]
MKNSHNNSVTKFFRKALFFGIVFLGIGLNAQEGETVVQDSVKTGYDSGQIYMKNPKSIVEVYEYDAVLDKYILNSKLGDFTVSYPLFLTPKEYEDLLLRESISNYFKDKNKAAASTDPEEQRDLLPSYKVHSKLFESIFGSNTIDVRPTGSVEMDLGMRYSKQDNPSLSPRNRTVLGFDFDQRISVGLMGMVGTRLKVTANYDTQSTFDFQNLFKLEYTPDEDDIIRKIEIGNVSLPLNTSLIRGAQSLFGVKAQLQFGKTTFTGIFSEQRSQTKGVTIEGGGMVQDFELFALEYDADRHYFLSQYFRDKYDSALKNYPLIDSRIQITRIEVWITNKNNRINATPMDGFNNRNIIALQDLGESPLSSMPDNKVVAINQNHIGGFFNVMANTPSNNKNNKYDPKALGSNYLKESIRDLSSGNDGFRDDIKTTINEGTDFVKIENARKLNQNEYTFHPQLGYVSLNQRLNNDEVLAVAYQYTVGGDVYQVGEFGTDGVDATVVNPNPDPDMGDIPSTQALILKMLKSNITNVGQPVWNLMMKNIYSIPGGAQLEQDGFRFNILYTDPSPVNYITAAAGAPALPEDVENTPLLKVFHLDRLNYTNDPQPGGDGFFDYVANATGNNPLSEQGQYGNMGDQRPPQGGGSGQGNAQNQQQSTNTFTGITIDPRLGRIIFTSVEPFGSHLFDKLKTSENSLENYDDPTTYNLNQKKYVFSKMYTSTQAGSLQESDKNKFQLKGRFKSTTGDGISIGAFNVPKGSVIVRAGGRVLIEGQDYTVDYQQGKVHILDPSLQASGTPIDISVENNQMFGQQTKRFFGFNVEHKFTDKFLVGATLLRLSEKPFTQKSSYGQESVNNTIYGVNFNYSTEVPFLTRLVNKLPNIDTDVPSNFSIRGELAVLQSDTPTGDKFGGETTVYVEDFEGSQTNLDIKSPSSWALASVPIGYGGLNPNTDVPNDDIDSGFRRAKLSWYTIDPVFYTSQRPSGLSENDFASNKTRRIYVRELFPVNDVVQGQSTVVPTLDLSYYPTERGPYNFSPLANGSNTIPNPQNNWGGMMRGISSTNFEQANVEYVQFWMLDPYVGNPGDVANPFNSGQLKINLGEISEDILKDGRKMYENGLPEAGSNQATYATPWGKVPASQSLIYAFDTSEANRAAQDLGFDGLNDDEEAMKFPQFAGIDDPAQDNYQSFMSGQGSVLDRYKRYNGTQGNSPVNLTDGNRGSTTLPDVEDVNRDNTMNTIDSYYEYSIDILPNMQEGQNYVTNVMETTASFQGQGPNGETTTPARWIQFKVPIAEGESINGIADVRSIRFMRMFVTGFTEPVTLRFGTLDLVRSEWRRYTNTLDPFEDNSTDGLDNTSFDVQTVNIQENGNRSPIKYITPPGVEREQLYQNNTLINQNEQSLSLRISSADGGYNGGLEPQDARAVFKNVNVDMRQYKRLKMFLHAESLPKLSADNPNGEVNPLQDDQMIAFIRFGNDFTQNFYQVEVPLKVTQEGAIIDTDVWPEANNMDISLDLMTQLKILSIGINWDDIAPEDNGIFFKDVQELDPSSTSNHRIGIKGNPNFGYVRTLMLGLKNGTETQDIRGEAWFNELRLVEMDNRGGMAATLSMDTNFADFANISATGNMNTIGFGGIEDKPNQRSREERMQYNIVSAFQLGKLLPKSWYFRLPFSYSIGEEFVTPEYDPFYQDIRLQQYLDTETDAGRRAAIKDRAIEYTKIRSINFIGVKKDRAPEQKPRIYDPENLTLSYSYTQTDHHDYEVEDLLDQQVQTTADYSYNFDAKPVEPFKKTEAFKSKYWKIFQDFNFNYLPSSITFNTSILRNFNRQQFRQVDLDANSIGIDPMYRRNYMFNYNYGFNYNLTKKLKLNYNVTTSNIVRSYLDEDSVPDNSQGIWDDYWNTGEPNQHTQRITANYDLPLEKIPFLSFFKSTYMYNSNFNWQRTPDGLRTITVGENDNLNRYDLGNTIQNSNSHQINTTLNMDLFYKYIGLTKKPQAKKPSRPGAAPVPGQRVSGGNTPQANERSMFVEGLIGVATTLKTLQLNYTENNGTVLPGYLPSIGFLGTSRPSLGFVMGSQDDVRYEAAQNGWLTNYPYYNQSYTQVSTKLLNYTASLEPFSDFKIDLSGDRNYSNNYSEQFDVMDGNYYSRSPYNTGNFSISTNMISTAFAKSDENFSQAFQDFRDNRIDIANRLAGQRGIDLTNPNNIGPDGFPKNYGKTSQEVLLPAFMAAYTGQSSSGVNLGIFRDIPIPGWNIRYTGLMRYNFFKDKFRRFSIQHGYKATYSINAYRSNFEHDPNQQLDPSVIENYKPSTIVSNVNLVEQFNPLIRVDFEMKNSIQIRAEIKRDRALSLSFDNNLLTEMQGETYTIGTGYRIKDVIINTALADNATNTIKSDINLKVDLNFTNNKTIVRYLDYDNNELGGGQNLWSAKFMADYSFSRNFTVLLYYDHSFSKAVISTAYPITNIRAGFTLRYTFGN